MIAENVKIVRQRIVSACVRVQRTPEEITLIAVTKTFSSNLVKEVTLAGIKDIGENYVQELCRKREKIADDSIRWHFIGHLQSNKVKHIVPWIYCIHSVDTISLGKEISRQAERSGRPRAEVLVEVNTSGETTKFGVKPAETILLVKDLSRCSNIRVSGLMTIGPFLPDPESSRPAFQVLAYLKKKIVQEGIPMQHLSMGMTNDFEIAIEEGATMIRIGTAILGKRKKVD